MIDYKGHYNLLGRAHHAGRPLNLDLSIAGWIRAALAWLEAILRADAKIRTDKSTNIRDFKDGAPPPSCEDPHRKHQAIRRRLRLQLSSFIRRTISHWRRRGLLLF